MDYPLENNYVFYLPSLNIFDAYHLGSKNIMDIHIYPEISQYDTEPHDYRFITLHCNGVQNHDIAWVIGIELLNILKGLIKIFNEEYDIENIRVLEMKNNLLTDVIYSNHKISYNVNINPLLYNRLGQDVFMKLNYRQRNNYKDSVLSNIYSGGYYLAQKYIGIYILIKYFSEPLTWSSLYKIDLLRLYKSMVQGQVEVPEPRTHAKNFII